MSEEWKDIKEYNNYQISNFGRIKSKNYKRQGYEKILKQSVNGRGYYYVLISTKNKYKNLLIHKEVAKAFIDNKNNYTDVNHKDGNKLNNNVENLEWCSRSYNITHAYKNGLKKSSMGMSYKKRCQLAIEYIENSDDFDVEVFSDTTGGCLGTDLSKGAKHLLEILKGENDESN